VDEEGRKSRKIRFHIIIQQVSYSSAVGKEVEVEVEIMQGKASGADNPPTIGN